MLDERKDNLLESQGGEESERWQEVRMSQLERADRGERREVRAPGGAGGGARRNTFPGDSIRALLAPVRPAVR